MNPRKWPAYIAMATAMVTVGSTLVASKMMGEMPVFIASLMRFAIASPVLLCLARATGRKWPRLNMREWAVLCAQAGLGSVGYSVLLIAGLSRTVAADASVIAGTLPAVVALLAWAVLRERPGGWSLVAIALATLGVGILALHGEPGPDGASRHHRLLGDALVLAAVACEAIFLLLNKAVATPVDPLVVAAIMAVLSMLFCAVPAAVQWSGMGGQPMPARAIGAAVYYALVPTVLGFWLWYFGASRVSGAEAGLFTAVFPVSGLMLSATLLGESLTPAHGVGAGLCVLGIFLGTRASSPAETARDGH
jgi:drug/metabolite transporter (DMT)-like permease